MREFVFARTIQNNFRLSFPDTPIAHNPSKIMNFRKSLLLSTACMAQFLMPAHTCLAEEAWQVTAKIWGAMGKKDWNEVERLANQANRTWGESARKANNQITKLPGKDEAKGYATLNELATITYLKGEALYKKGDRDGALAAYYTLIADFNYGQCWDKAGWWWQPAFAARDRIAELTPGSQTEVSIDADPLPANLALDGKKGICFTLRKSNQSGSVEENLPKIQATRSYWNYSWGMELVEEQPSKMEFMPMAWGAWGMDGFVQSVRKHIVPQIQSGVTKRVLGFNEPDKKEQANMSYQDALKYWPVLEELGVPLCSPACANPLSDVDDSTQGVRGTWMRDFMREADKRNYRIDYIGVHWYGATSPRAFKERMAQVYEAYGRRPLLISEFAVADWGAKTVGQNSHSPEEVLKFMKNVLPWMEKQNWIAGYAWFSFGIHEAVGTSSSLFDQSGKLTTLGKFYSSVTNENPDGDQSIR